MLATHLSPHFGTLLSNEETLRHLLAFSVYKLYLDCGGCQVGKCAVRLTVCTLYSMEGKVDNPSRYTLKPFIG